MDGNEKSTEKIEEKLDELKNADQKVARLAEYCLEHLQSTDEKTSKTAREIRETAKELYPKLFDQIKEGTFNVYLSRAPTINPKVISLGVARGYYYDVDGKFAEQEPDPEEVEGANTCKKQKEAKLYNHVKNWLSANGYRAKTIASGRSLGPWGNPDVVGIQVSELLGQPSFQAVSIEVKASIDGWQKQIFEAISHKRFFDRCYYCFPVRANNREIPEQMKDYAQLYGVGILLLELTEEALKNLEKANEVSGDDLEVIEACPAPISSVASKYRRDAFSALEINSMEELFGWGE